MEKGKYAPFILAMETGSLLLPDRDMGKWNHIFEARAGEGWIGNGYDWAAIAGAVLQERLPGLAGVITFDPEAGMFAAHGPLASLELLAAEMQKVFEDEALLRHFMNLAKPG